MIFHARRSIWASKLIMWSITRGRKSSVKYDSVNICLEWFVTNTYNIQYVQISGMDYWMLENYWSKKIENVAKKIGVVLIISELVKLKKKRSDLHLQKKVFVFIHYFKCDTCKSFMKPYFLHFPWRQIPKLFTYDNNSIWRTAVSSWTSYFQVECNKRTCTCWSTIDYDIDVNFLK